MGGISIGRGLSGTTEAIDLLTPEQRANNAIAEHQRLERSAGKKRGPKPGGVRRPRPAVALFEHPIYGMMHPSELRIYLPTPDEIAERTAEIRAGWSRREEAARREGMVGAVPVRMEPVTLAVSW